jgi:hypothetical protein
MPGSLQLCRLSENLPHIRGVELNLNISIRQARRKKIGFEKDALERKIWFVFFLNFSAVSSIFDFTRLVY